MFSRIQVAKFSALGFFALDSRRLVEGREGEQKSDDLAGFFLQLGQVQEETVLIQSRTFDRNFRFVVVEMRP